MNRSISVFRSGLLVLGLVFASFAAGAQQPVYKLNQQDINLKKGVELSAYQQAEAVVLSLNESGVNTEYDSVVLYLARGNRPLLKQTLELERGTSMDISRALELAEKGDRLVLEIFPKKEEKTKVTVVALN